MITKGSQRAGGQQLATHLLNEFDNDRVEVAQVRGAIAQDLHGAFAEWSATATGTKCRKYLYSLSINPDPEQGPLTPEQYLDFVERAEEKLGLTGQPRAVVFHVKHGREHCHAVWSRIDTETMRAAQLSHDRHKLRSVVLDFARDHGLELPKGVTRDRTKDSSPRRPPETWAEKQQVDRTGITRDERMRAVTEAWEQSRDAQGLIQALEARGYLLARGDRRAYVVIDRFGEIHSLARQIKGVRTKAVKERLSAYPLDRLPDARRAQAFARERREALQQERIREQRETGRQEPKKAEDHAPTRAEERRQALASAHATRRARLAAKRKALEEQHQRERETLRELQEAANRGVAENREASRPKGILAFLSRITGIDVVRERRERRQDEKRREEHRRQTEALQRRHVREMQDFSRRENALAKIETREARSLESKLRRAEFARIARGPGPPRPPRPPVPPITPPFTKAAGSDKPKAPPPSLTPKFKETADPPKAPDPITPSFSEAADPPKPPERHRSTGGISPSFSDAASGTPVPDKGETRKTPTDPDRNADPDKDGSLSEAFRRALEERAERKRAEKEKKRKGRDQDRNGPRGPGRNRGP